MISGCIVGGRDDKVEEILGNPDGKAGHLFEKIVDKEMLP